VVLDVADAGAKRDLVHNKEIVGGEQVVDGLTRLLAELVGNLRPPLRANGCVQGITGGGVKP
jgi:hypothetical protein